MAVKRPLPFQNQSRTLKAASAVQPGDLVEINSSGNIAKGTASDAEYIGIVTYDHAKVADTGTTVFAANSLVSVEMRGKTIRAVASAPITTGNFVKQAANGEVAPEATPGTKTLNTIGIALTSAGTSAEVDFVQL